MCGILYKTKMGLFHGLDAKLWCIEGIPKGYSGLR